MSLLTGRAAAMIFGGERQVGADPWWLRAGIPEGCCTASDGREEPTLMDAALSTNVGYNVRRELDLNNLTVWQLFFAGFTD